MNKERETLITDLSINAVDGFFYITQKLQAEIRELLTQPDINTKYLLDQVARLTVENAMLNATRDTLGREEKKVMSYNKITIDLEDLKSYIKSLPTDMEEWYNEEWALYAEGIHAYVKTIDLKFADTFKYFIDEYYEERNKANRGE